MKSIINPGGMWKPDPSKGWTFSQGVQVEGKKMVFVSGQGAFDSEGNILAKGNVREQTKHAIEGIKRVLEEAGCSLDDVVKVTVYLKRIEDRSAVAEIRKQYFRKDFPASSLVAVQLANDDMLVEIEAIAVTG